MVQLRLGAFQLGVHALGGGAAEAAAQRTARAQVDGGVDVLLKEAAHGLVLGQGQGVQREAALDAHGHQPAGELVGVSEGHALFGKVVGAVGGIDEASGGRRPQVVRQHLHGVDEGGQGGEAQVEGVHRVKDGLLVLLHVLVVGQGQALHHHQQGGQIAADPPRFAPDELVHVGVLLLGHDGGAGGEGVVQLDELELPAAPEDDLLRQAGQVHHAGGDDRRQLDAEIPVGHAVQAVLAGAVEAQRRGGGVAVDGVGGARQRAAAQGADVHPLFPVRKAVHVPQEHLHIGQQVMAEGDRLGPLQMGVAGHHVRRMGGGLLEQRVAEGGHLLVEGARRVPQEQAQVHRHLVVAAAAGVQPLARLADALCQLGLHKGVDVLGGGVDGKGPALQVRQDALKALLDGRAVRLGNDALPGEHGRVGHAAGDVLGGHAPVEPDGGIEVVHTAVHRFAEPSLPQLHGPTLLRLICSSFSTASPARGWTGRTG